MVKIRLEQHVAPGWATLELEAGCENSNNVGTCWNEILTLKSVGFDFSQFMLVL